MKYGLVDKDDLDAAAQIFMNSFPHRVGTLFSNEHHAQAFYRDLMELMSLAYGQTFFVARSDDGLVGYLILTVPGHGLITGMFRDRFVFRAIIHALSGAYGWSPFTLGRIIRSAFRIGKDAGSSDLADSPHVSVVAVRQSSANRGVGSALIQRARLACQSDFYQMWLCVELSNTGAIRLYERLGFRKVRSNEMTHVMAWDFSASAENACA